MMTSKVSINGCLHYIANEAGSEKLYFFDTRFLVEADYTINHPLGIVYRAKGVIDTNVRFLRQPDRSLLLFNKVDWERRKMPYGGVCEEWFREECSRYWRLLKQLKSGKTATILFG